MAFLREKPHNTVLAYAVFWYSGILLWRPQKRGLPAPVIVRVAFLGEKRRIPFWLMVFRAGAPKGTVFGGSPAYFWDVARGGPGFWGKNEGDEGTAGR
jgi:hypothetical protein